MTLALVLCSPGSPPCHTPRAPRAQGLAASSGAEGLTLLMDIPSKRESKRMASEGYAYNKVLIK